MAILEGIAAEWRRCVAVVAGVALCALALPLGAFATSPAGCSPSAAPALCPPVASQPFATSSFNADGTVTVTAHGTYSWYAQLILQASGQPGDDRCGGRYGIGWSMIWNDPADPAAMTLSGNGISEGVGSSGNSLNPPDASVHYNANDPCGSPRPAADPNTGVTQTVPVGEWGPATAACVQPGQGAPGVATCPATPGHPSAAPALAVAASSHTYASTAQLPASICVDLYVLQAPYTPGDPNYSIAQTDNAITGGEFDATPGNGWCFSPSASTPPGAPPSTQSASLAGHIYQCAKPGVDLRGGSVTFSGMPARPAPVRFGRVQPGMYRVSASAPPGFVFVSCASKAYSIDADGTARYRLPGLSVRQGATGLAIFYAAPAAEPQARSARTARFTVALAASPSGSAPTRTPVTYTVRVTNTGARPARPGLVTDTVTLTSGLTAIVSTAASADIGSVTGPSAGATLTAPSASWTWDLSTVQLSPRASATFTVGLQAQSPGTVADTALLARSNCALNGATGCEVSTAVADLVLTKQVDQGGSVGLGTSLKYTIDLQNPTDNGATDVVMTDVMGGSATPSVDRASFLTTPAVLNGNVGCTVANCATFTWTWLDVAGHSTATLVYDALIEAPAGARGSV
ncbi:MAG: hypothetical protein JO198_09665, partial [Candidatus Dormibacteraeota bacterium]|nr:hypothetical protein [Candidatus Dormibacteraeota bacterium]